MGRFWIGLNLTYMLQLYPFDFDRLIRGVSNVMLVLRTLRIISLIVKWLFDVTASIISCVAWGSCSIMTRTRSIFSVVNVVWGRPVRGSSRLSLPSLNWAAHLATVLYFGNCTIFCNHLLIPVHRLWFLLKLRV